MDHKKLVTHTESHASAVSLLENREYRYIKAIKKKKKKKKKKGNHRCLII